MGPVTARYNASLGHYGGTGIEEWMHVPAVGVAISPNLSVLGELVGPVAELLGRPASSHSTIAA